MSRPTASLLMILMLLLGPALCMGGLLEHHCDCGDGAECQHEETCASDPCSDTVKPEDRDDLLAHVAPMAAALPAPGEGLERLIRCGAPAAVRPVPPDRPRLAYAVSDRPLRI